MSALKNLVGQKFGRLTVLERAENAKDGHARWKCRCDCGREVVVFGNSLIRGVTKSCGCLHDELTVQRSTKHGKCHSKTYRLWAAIKTRCFNPNYKAYKHYGGRGITIYEPWRNDFAAFYDYVSKLEHFGEEGYTLDRKDNGGNYEPGNLQWATQKEQNRNQRTNVIVEYNGERMTLVEAAERSGIDYDALRYRIDHCWSGDKLFDPSRKN